MEFVLPVLRASSAFSPGVRGPRKEFAVFDTTTTIRTILLFICPLFLIHSKPTATSQPQLTLFGGASSPRPGYIEDLLQLMRNGRNVDGP
uniref:Uncharacterized protein n=1 Tax=Steinernema glaseri TaxID=37863 RepID=A0A1I7YBI3_9BILA